MKQVTCAWMSTVSVAVAFVAVAVFAGPIRAQGHGGPLTVQGLQQQNTPSAAARAFGGVTMRNDGDIGLMFANPSSLQSMGGLRISVAGFRQSQDLRQEQNFAPVRYYPNLSLLLEGLTDQIPDPDPDLVGFTSADSVQRAFDDISPNWSRSNTHDWPLHALIAVPISLGDLTITAGAGAVQYANLNHYYQNNNVLDPAVLSQRPLPTIRPTDNNPVTVNWYQSMRSREGFLRGYGVALSGHLESYGLTVGLSGLFLNGESDDFEQQLQRGELTFFANEFRADSVVGRVTRSGSSEFSGQEFTLSSTLAGKFVSVGFVVRPPTRFTRTFELEVQGDTTGTPFTSTASGEDTFQLPWRGSVGLLIQPREKLRIGLEYEFRPYRSATYTSADAVETSPWHSASVFRIGAEYALSSWLVLRGGMRGEAEVFVPEGSAIQSDPAAYRVFGGGIGINFSGFQWNITYEFANLKYEDIWGSSLSRNDDERHTIITEISYTIPIWR